MSQQTIHRKHATAKKLTATSTNDNDNNSNVVIISLTNDEKTTTKLHLI